MKETIRETLDELTSLAGAPGFEQPVVEHLVDSFSATGASVSVDPMGNLYAQLGSEGATPHLLIAAHSDEIAAIVRHVDEGGFISFDALGGMVAKHLLAQRVLVDGHLGVVGMKPGHLQTDEERRQVPAIEELRIDVGAHSDVEVAELGIGVGSIVTYHSPLMPFTNSDRVNGKAIDNRLGCALLLQLFRELKGEEISGRLTGLIAVQEEVGLRGATVGAYRANPDYALVMDTFPVGDTPDVARGRMPGAIGQGPVLVAAAASRRTGRGHITHPRVALWLEEAAEQAQVAVQPATSIGWAVTDAAAVHLSRGGVPTGVVGLPRRYSHSPICVFDLNDGVGAVRLLQQFVANMAEHTDLSFI